MGNNIPWSLKITLLKPASKYCNIEVCPNLKCRLADPKIILFSLSILIKGRWYRPASGLLTLSKLINKAKNTENINEILSFLKINFLFKKNI